LLGHHDADVPAGAQALDLRDGHGALVEATAVGAGDVAPAAARSLGLDAEIDRASEDIFELLAPLAVLLLAVDRGQEQHREAVAVHVPPGLRRVVGVADQAVALAAFDQPIDGPADVLRVLPLAHG